MDNLDYRDDPTGGEKSKRVRAVFDTVAPRYDLMNDLMSGGVHRLWKEAMIDWLHPQPGMALLDVAGGTGDIASRFVRRLGRRGVTDLPPVRVCDINELMLKRGMARLARQPNIASAITWLCGNAEQLPIASQSVDAYTIAFGIRNVSHIDRALEEAYRVLRPGGRFLCLEFSAVRIPGLDRLYDGYSRHILPQLGEWVAGDRSAYEYLVASIRRFPDQSCYQMMIEQAGFAHVKVRNLSGGIAALHSAWRI